MTFMVVLGLQMWGVGGEDGITQALEAQGKARELTAENIAKARKVSSSGNNTPMTSLWLSVTTGKRVE